jgi:hypothetical protein
MSHHYLVGAILLSWLFLTAPSFPQTTRKGPYVAYAIPADVLKYAKKEYKTKEGSKYDGEMFPGNPSEIMDPVCLNQKGTAGWTNIVIVIQKDGTPSHIFAEKHSLVADCLVPRLATAKFTPPPHAPFFEYFQLFIKK